MSVCVCVRVRVRAVICSHVEVLSQLTLSVTRLAFYERIKT